MIIIKFSVIDVEFDCSYIHTGEFDNYLEAQRFMNENRAVGNEIHVLRYINRTDRGRLILPR